MRRSGLHALYCGPRPRIVPRLRGIHTGELPLNDQVLDVR